MSGAAALSTGAIPGVGVLLRLKLRLLRNRLRQLLDQSPLTLILAMVFIGTIWFALYEVFENVFIMLRRFEQPAVIAIPYVFHVFFVAMTFLLAFSTAVLVYGALFSRAEPSFLLAMPHSPRHVVTIMFLESMFFASWSLLLLGLPLMVAIGQVQGLAWHFYLVFIVAFLGFVPIPGALGLLAAFAVALWLPRLAKQTLVYSIAGALILVIVWWGRLWAVSSHESSQWLAGFLSELQVLKSAMLPSTWVTHAIRYAIEHRPGDAVFYLGVTLSTAAFFSWAAVSLVGVRLMRAFGRAHSAPTQSRATSGSASTMLTNLCFFYAPPQLRLLVLKDVRNFLRDPVQWSQLVILFGLLALYLAYLPRTRPEGFSVAWQALICFLNYGAVTLILSTFTSRFVFPMISMEGRQMWLVGLWPMSRGQVVWAKFLYAVTITAIAAMSVTILSIRTLDLPASLAWVQVMGTLSTCLGLCGMAVGMGARFPQFAEVNAGRIASGLGGTVNLIASVGLVAIGVAGVGGICYRLVQAGNLAQLDGWSWLLFAGLIVAGPTIGWVCMRVGLARFRRQQF